MGSLLFQNEACLVINKLSGESSESPEIKAEEKVYQGKTFPVHRIDTPVSGCLLLARTQKAAAFLGEAFSHEAKGGEANGGESSRIIKRYWAIIEKPKTTGLAQKILPGEGELIHWLIEDKRANKSFAFSEEELSMPGNAARIARSTKPKKARLRYRFSGEGDNYLFMEIELVTGRHHQIRAQLAACSLHVKGDLKYGAKRSEKNGGIRLHAYSLTFPNPLNTEETILVKAQPPQMDPLWTAFAAAIT